MPPLASDLLDCLRFWSRLPLPLGDTPDLSRSVRMLPVAGLVIALPAVATLLAARSLGLPDGVCAGLAIGALIATTGALHEDGLADCADGLFGGTTRAQRLDIMRDSRIGAFGAIALGLSLILRVIALAALIDVSPMLAAAALFTVAAVSRTAGLLPLVLLSPARPDGLGASVTSPKRDALVIAPAIAAASLLLCVLAGASPSRTVFAGLGASAAAYLLVPLARAKIGGQTGDVAGAAQQASEIAFLTILSGAAGS